MKSFRMNVVDWSALVLVVVGALNWGLVGIAHFVDSTANWNLVNILLGSVPAVEFAVYLLVGLAGLWTAYLAYRLSELRIEEIADTSEPEMPGRPAK